jgi:hypothetical protein
MPNRDDEKDILGQSASNPEQYARADHGRLDMLRNLVRQTQGKEITEQQAVQRLDALKHSVSGQSDDEKKRTERVQREADAKNIPHAATKTRKQEEADAVLGADAKPTPEGVIDQNARMDQAQQELEDTDEMAQMG